jgi:predicted nucleotidyltransferase
VSDVISYHGTPGCGEETMTEKDFKIVERFKSLVSQKVKVHEIRVFGSRARGNATEESDLDVLVVVDRLDHSIEQYISDCAWEAGFPEDVVVMPVSITRDTLENSPIRESVFIRNVYREGIAA